MKIIFVIDPEQLTWDDLDAMEAAQDSGRLRPVRTLLARFMVDEAGAALPAAEAMALLGKLTVPQITTTLNEFSATLQRQKNTALPPDNSGA